MSTPDSAKPTSPASGNFSTLKSQPKQVPLHTLKSSSSTSLITDNRTNVFTSNTLRSHASSIPQAGAAQALTTDIETEGPS